MATEHEKWRKFLQPLVTALVTALSAYAVASQHGSEEKTEAQNGVMKVSFSMPSAQYNDALTLFQVELDVPASANLGQNSYPVLVELRLTDADSNSAHETMATGVLCRTSSNSQWKFVSSFMFDFRRIAHEWSQMEIELDCGAWTIPQNTEIIYSIAHSVFV